MVIHARGLCAGCYNSTFYLQQNKDYNNKKRHNISPELYNQITKKCLLCNFDKLVALHHLDCNRYNNCEDNMIGLCPNHHKLVHTLKYGKETMEKIKQRLKEKKEQTNDKGRKLF